MQKHEITTAVSPRNDNLIRATCSKCGEWVSAAMVDGDANLAAMMATQAMQERKCA